LLLIFFDVSLCGLSCLNSDQDPVDSFAALKNPDGYKYNVYSDGTFQDGGSLDKATGPIGNTLKSLYSCSNCAYVLYNDESPDGKVEESRAHMKGVLAFNGDSGFWLVHSVPNFPEFFSKGYSYPDTETTYGQSFLCITLNISSFDIVGLLFQIDFPYVYDYSLPSSIQKKVPNLVNYVVKGKHITESTTNFTSIYSKAGVQYDVFAKNKQWNKELYENLVAPTYNTDLSVETWQNGVGKIGSYCKPKYKYNVLNVVLIQMPDGTSYKETEDHSKWAISNPGNYVCIGDINRVEGQFKRGGGTVCTSDSQLWIAFNSIISQVENC